MKLINVIPWILIVVGAFLNYIVPIILKKNSKTEDLLLNNTHLAILNVD